MLLFSAAVRRKRMRMKFQKEISKMPIRQSKSTIKVRLDAEVNRATGAECTTLLSRVIGAVWHG